MSDQEMGQAIKRERELVGVTQVELAEAAGITRVALAQYEIGNRAVGPLILQRIADALGLRVERLRNESPVQQQLRDNTDRRYVRRPKFNARDAFTGA